LRRGGRGLVVVEEHHQVAEDVQQEFVGAAGGLLLGADLRRRSCGVVGVVRGDVADVGRRGRPAGTGSVWRGEGADDRLALRRPGRDGRALDAEVRPSKSM
jgi:hypothetical protein